MKDDKVLLEYYMLGFNDELKQVNIVTEFEDLILKEAYELGRIHALVGDDVSSVDLLTDTEILKMIKNRQNG